MAVTSIPRCESDVYYRPSFDVAVKAATQAMEDAFDGGWTVSVTAFPDPTGGVTLHVDYTPTEH